MTPLPKPPPIPFLNSPSQQVVAYLIMGFATQKRIARAIGGYRSNNGIE